jgi:transposase
MSNIRYTDQFKKDAANLVIENGYSLNAAAEATGVCHSTIKSWVAKQKGELPAPTKFASLEDELKHLRKENTRLRMEREILKKATAFFAKENKS